MRRFAEFISGLVELVPICLHGVFGEPRRVGSVGVLGFSSPVNERVHQHDSVINAQWARKNATSYIQLNFRFPSFIGSYPVNCMLCI